MSSQLKRVFPESKQKKVDQLKSFNLIFSNINLNKTGIVPFRIPASEVRKRMDLVYENCYQEFKKILKMDLVDPIQTVNQIISQIQTSNEDFQSFCNFLYTAKKLSEDKEIAFFVNFVSGNIDSLKSVLFLYVQSVLKRKYPEIESGEKNGKGEILSQKNVNELLEEAFKFDQYLIEEVTGLFNPIFMMESKLSVGRFYEHFINFEIGLKRNDLVQNIKNENELKKQYKDIIEVRQIAKQGRKKFILKGFEMKEYQKEEMGDQSSFKQTVRFDRSKKTVNSKSQNMQKTCHVEIKGDRGAKSKDQSHKTALIRRLITTKLLVKERNLDDEYEFKYKRLKSEKGKLNPKLVEVNSKYLEPILKKKVAVNGDNKLVSNWTGSQKNGEFKHRFKKEDSSNREGTIYEEIKHFDVPFEAPKISNEILNQKKHPSANEFITKRKTQQKLFNEQIRDLEKVKKEVAKIQTNKKTVGKQCKNTNGKSFHQIINKVSDFLKKDSKTEMQENHKKSDLTEKDFQESKKSERQENQTNSNLSSVKNRELLTDSNPIGFISAGNLQSGSLISQKNQIRRGKEIETLVLSQKTTAKNEKIEVILEDDIEENGKLTELTFPSLKNSVQKKKQESTKFDLKINELEIWKDENKYDKPKMQALETEENKPNDLWWNPVMSSFKTQKPLISEPQKEAVRSNLSKKSENASFLGSRKETVNIIENSGINGNELLSKLGSASQNPLYEHNSSISKRLESMNLEELGEGKSTLFLPIKSSDLMPDSNLRSLLSIQQKLSVSEDKQSKKRSYNNKQASDVYEKESLFKEASRKFLTESKVENPVGVNYSFEEGDVLNDRSSLNNSVGMMITNKKILDKERNLKENETKEKPQMGLFSDLEKNEGLFGEEFSSDVKMNDKYSEMVKEEKTGEGLLQEK